MAVTIAIPFYNAEKYLLDSIKSVFAQTHQEWELILIDDGSTDNSLAIAKSIIDPRVRVISDGINKRLAARLNEVTQLAKYEFIARMDADDLMMPNRIEKQLEVFAKNNVDVVTTGVYSVNNNLELMGVRGWAFNSVTTTDILSKKVGIVHAAVMAKKSWYQRNKYNENLKIAQDLDLWLSSANNEDLSIISINEPLYIYREENNVTRYKLLNAYNNERHMLKKYINNYKLFELKIIIKSIIVILCDTFYGLDFLQKKRNNTQIRESDKNKYVDTISKINVLKINVENE